MYLVDSVVVYYMNAKIKQLQKSVVQRVCWKLCLSWGKFWSSGV